MKGLTENQQKKTRAAIKALGMSIAGWARVHEFKVTTVRAVLYSEYGRRKNLTPKAEEILTQLQWGRLA